MVQMQMQELQIKQGDLERKVQKDQMDHAIEQARVAIERERIGAQQQGSTANIVAKLAGQELKQKADEKAQSLGTIADLAKQEMTMASQQANAGRGVQ
jgi:hypothetical protein